MLCQLSTRSPCCKRKCSDCSFSVAQLFSRLLLPQSPIAPYSENEPLRAPRLREAWPGRARRVLMSRRLPARNKQACNTFRCFQGCVVG